MKKQRKQFLLMLLVLLVVTGGYFGLRYYNENAVTEEPAVETEYVVSIEKDSIQHISYSYEDVEYAFTKDGEEWIYDMDSSVNIDSYYINLMETRCEGLTVKEKIENVTDMSQYGLAEPERYFAFETAEGTYTFYIGDRNTISYGYYICEPESNTIYLVDNLVGTAFSKTLEDLIEEEEAESDTTAE